MTGSWGHSRGGTPDPWDRRQQRPWGQVPWAQNPWNQHLRIGDAERERAAAELAEHYAAGRITTEEHSERLDQIWGARTPADLAPVFADLPRGDRPPWVPPGAPVGHHARPSPPRRRGGVPAPLVMLFVVLLLVTVVTHLPVILIAVALWFLLSRAGRWR
ncbi:DUF1707 domain-containing protein [Nocardioides sp. GCM10027113]|uniref:DUF1707 SHOCT-like domain-containing protein n=1 Tax=unclassified Nocardioides TaxID=2615069 RepID=UPI00361293B5